MRRIVVIMGMLLCMTSSAEAKDSSRIVIYSGSSEDAQVEAARIVHDYHINGGAMSYMDLEDVAFPGERGLMVLGAKTWTCTQKEPPSYIDDLIEKAVSSIDELELEAAVVQLDEILPRLACSPDRKKIGRVMFLRGYVEFIGGDAMEGIHYFEYAAAADSDINWDDGYAKEAGAKNIGSYFDDAKASADRARRGISVFQRDVEIVPDTASITIEGMYNETKIPVPGMLVLTWDDLGVEQRMLAMVDTMNPVTIVTRTGFRQILAEGPTGDKVRDEIVRAALASLERDKVTVAILHAEEPPSLYTWSSADPKNPFTIHLPSETGDTDTGKGTVMRVPGSAFSVAAAYMPIGTGHYSGFSVWGDIGFKRDLGLRLHVGGGLGMSGDSEGYYMYFLPYGELGVRWVFDPVKAPNWRFMIGGHVLIALQDTRSGSIAEVAGLGCGGVSIKPNAKAGAKALPPSPFLEICGGAGTPTGVISVRIGVSTP